MVGQGVHLKQPEQSALRILVPVNGTEVSHRAAEVAITIARAFEAPITALYVTRGARRTRQRQRSLRSYRQEQAILKEIVELADQYDQKVKTAVHSDVAVESAILQTVKGGKHDLVVMGVSRRRATSCSSATQSPPCSKRRRPRSCWYRRKAGSLLQPVPRNLARRHPEVLGALAPSLEGRPGTRCPESLLRASTRSSFEARFASTSG